MSIYLSAVIWIKVKYYLSFRKLGFTTFIIQAAQHYISPQTMGTFDLKQKASHYKCFQAKWLHGLFATFNDPRMWISISWPTYLSVVVTEEERKSNYYKQTAQFNVAKGYKLNTGYSRNLSAFRILLNAFSFLAFVVIATVVILVYSQPIFPTGKKWQAVLT